MAARQATIAAACAIGVLVALPAQSETRLTYFTGPTGGS